MQEARRTRVRGEGPTGGGSQTDSSGAVLERERLGGVDPADWGPRETIDTEKSLAEGNDGLGRVALDRPFQDLIAVEWTAMTAPVVKWMIQQMMTPPIRRGRRPRRFDGPLLDTDEASANARGGKLGEVHAALRTGDTNSETADDTANDEMGDDGRSGPNIGGQCRRPKRQRLHVASKRRDGPKGRRGEPATRAPTREPPDMGAVMPPWTVDDGWLKKSMKDSTPIQAHMELTSKPKSMPPMVPKAASAEHG